MESNFLLILLAFFLVLLNGFFVAAEFGLVKLRQTRVKAIAKTYGWRGRILAKVHGQLDAYLSACQLGITLASLGLGWVGEPAFAKLLEPLLHQIGVDSPEIIHGASFIIAFFTISYLHIVLGELAPKSIAIRQAEKVGLWTGVPLYAFYWIMYPAIWMLNTSSNWILQKAGLSTGHAADAQYSADELKLILRSSRASEELTKDEWNILAHTLDFSDLEVADLMRPFNEAISLSAENTFEQNLEIISQHRYSRYPFVEKNGKVRGVIHLKSLFLAKFEAEELQDLSRFVHPAPFVSPDMPAIELFRRFREGKATHFAIVGRKGQEPVGFITLDNMLGALVGEIRDEFRQSQNDWTKLDDGTLIGKGSLPIFTLERALGVEIDNDDEVDSVGGLVLSKLGDIPNEGDSIHFDQFDIVVKKMNGPRIILVRIHPKHAHE
ncbi:hemolysin family protein [Methylobacillus caricis]|uniref:hemolysin family protein n=1 Tax=Methylobacillus caricis TaxID=1971611 RepID=UPI001CFF90EF|nr:hemolysin family protein [Methylobacillus caricis]MCB5188800.1 hemolysin family protein [Methylobacillus caricis]